MKKIAVIIFSFICTLWHAQHKPAKDTVVIHYIKGDKLFACDFIKSHKGELIDVRKCTNKREILPGTDQFTKLYPPVKFFQAASKVIDTNYAYDLPYKKGQFFKVIQGYNGTFSHHNKNALDFDMPERTEVLAIRDGMVIKAVDSNNRRCPTSECAKFNNYILIQHSDRTVAGYHHLSKNSVFVNVGDVVKKGAVIALSGNTGFSRGPHLHLVCYAPDNRRGLKMFFRTGNGDRIEYLYEGYIYTKNY